MNKFHLIISDMFAPPVRTILSITTIAAVTAGMFIYWVLAAGIGLSLQRETSLLGADIIVLPSAAHFEPDETLFLGISEGTTMKDALEQRLSSFPEVGEITTQLYLRSLKLGCCSVRDYTLIAFDPETDFLIRPFLDNDRESSKWKHAVVAGCEAAHSIHGDKVMFFNNAFRVKNILPCTGLAVDSAFFISLDVAREIAGAQKGLEANDISSILIKLKDSEKVDFVSEQIEALDSNVKVYKVSKIVKKISERVRLVETLLGLSLAVLVVCGAGLLFFISWLTASSKKKEVALVKAIGVSPASMVFIYCTEMGITGIIGSVLGVVPGAAVIFNWTGKMMSDINAPFVLPDRSSIILYIVLTVAVATAVSIISGLIFSIKMMKIEPDTALKDSR